MQVRVNGSLAVLVALMLVLAGCAESAPSHPTTAAARQTPVATPAPSTPSPVSTPAATPRPIPSPTPVSSSAPPDVPVTTVGNFTFYNLTDAKAQSIEKSMRGFFGKLPRNKTERTEIAAQVAAESCMKGGRINETIFDGADELNRQGYRVYHVATLFKKQFNEDIQPERVKTVITTTGTVAKYTTVIGSYNEYWVASCNFDKDNPESVKQFYYAAASLGLELFLIQYQVYYKSAFVVTQMASHTRTFRLVHRLFGDDALRILMSETHWLVRNSFQGVNHFIGTEAAAMNISLSAEATDEHTIRSELERAYGFSFETAHSIEDLLRRVDQDTAIQCGKQAINNQSGSDGIGGVVDSITNSEYAELFIDGKITDDEFERLPDEIQADLKGCLLATS